MFETLSEERSLTNDSLIEGGQKIRRKTNRRAGG